MRATFRSEEEAYMKKWLKVAGVVCGVFVVAVLAILLLVNANDFRPTIQTELSNLLGRPITLGNLSFSLFKGSLVAKDIAIGDDPAFSTSPFLQAKSLEIGVEVGPLVLHRQVRITTLTIDTPAINLLHAENGRWNFSSIGGNAATSQKPSATSTVLPDLTLGQLKIKNGSATVSSIPAVRKPFVYSDIDVSVQQFSFLKPFSFQLSAKLPPSGSFDLSGNA